MMLPRRAERFAAVSLWMYAEEGTFEVGLPEGDPNSFVQAFEQAGCDVRLHEDRQRLTVTFHGEPASDDEDEHVFH